MIALSVKDLPASMTYRSVQMIARDEVESDLSFLGLLVMENRMKEQTTGVIETLQECEVGTIMATGDNVLTAISVARQCGIIEKETKVWLGELAHSQDAGKPYINWTSQEAATSSKNINISCSASEASRYDEQTAFTPQSLPWDYRDASIDVALTG